MFRKKGLQGLSLILIYVIILSIASPILAEAVGNQGEVKVDSGWIYHVEPAHYKLLSMDNNSSTPKIVHNGEVDLRKVVGYEGGWVYYTQNEQIWKMREDGADKTILLESMRLGTVLGIKNDYIYFREYNDTDYTTKTSRINIKTNVIDVITDDKKIDIKLLGEKSLYFLKMVYEKPAAGYLYKIDIETGEQSLLAQITDEAVNVNSTIYEYNDTVYVCTYDFVFKIDKTGNVSKFPIKGTVIDVKNNLIYFTNYENNTTELWNMELDGSNTRKLIDKGYEYIIGLKIIYAREGDDNHNCRLYSYDLEGNNKKMISDEIIPRDFISFNNDKIILRIFIDNVLERRREGDLSAEKTAPIKTSYIWDYKIENNKFDELKTIQTVSINKVWAIKLNIGIDKDTIEDNIIVIDKDGYVPPLFLQLDEDNKTVIVAPVWGNWEENMEYTIYIKNTLKTINGKPLLNQIKMKFKAL